MARKEKNPICPLYNLGRPCLSGSTKKIPRHQKGSASQKACQKKYEELLGAGHLPLEQGNNPLHLTSDSSNNSSRSGGNESEVRVREDGTTDFSKMKYKKQLEAMREHIDEQIGKFSIDRESYVKYLQFQSTLYSYSYGNQMLIHSQQRFDPNADASSVYRTEAQWKADGYEVNTTSPTFLRRPASVLKGKVEYDEDGDEIVDENGNPITNDKVLTFSSYKTYGSHDVYPAPPISPMQAYYRKQKERTDIEDSEALRQDLHNVAQEHDIEIMYKSPSEFKTSYRNRTTLSGGVYGFATKNSITGKNMIVINKEMAPSSVTSTLAHEMGHILCGHLDDEDSDYSKIHDRKNMEFEAESFAYAVCKNYDLDTSDASFGYLKNWMDANGEKDEEKVKENNKEIHRSLEKMTRALGKYYSTLEKQVTGTNEIERKKEINEKNKEEAKKKREEMKKIAENYE